MKYTRQVQGALDSLDASLARLYTLIKRGEQNEALHYMKEGELKERFEELQNMITIASTGNLGARGTSNTGTL